MRMSSFSAPIGLNFAQNFLDIYICRSWPPKSSRLQSGIKNFLQDFLKEALDPHKRMNLEFWHFAQSFLNVYPYHSLRPKSSIFYSGIMNVLQVSLVDAVETHRRFSSSFLIGQHFYIGWNAQRKVAQYLGNNWRVNIINFSKAGMGGASGGKFWRNR